MEELKNPYDRKRFIEDGFRIGVLSAVLGAGILTGCTEKEAAKEIEIGPGEDLMQEHGLLNRVLLIYETFSRHLVNKESFRRELITDAAGIIRTFIEEYHEKQEEESIFPRMVKAKQQVELVNTLLRQHQAGRNVTAQILQLNKSLNMIASEEEKMNSLLQSFVRMYRPHEAREDTVLFPGFRKIVSQHEYDSLGEDFEKNEHKHFGEDGFETMVNKVMAIEKELGIYELEQFTPEV